MSKKKHQLKLVTYPAGILTVPAKAVEFPLAPDFQRLVTEMIRICKKHDGIGLAAPQVGIDQRVIIVNLEEFNLPAFPLINPEIIKSSKKQVESEEGCLSLPGIYVMITRPEKVDVKAQSLEGKTLEFKADGLLARVIQHEVDHINGILFIDHLSEKDRNNLLKKYGQENSAAKTAM